MFQLTYISTAKQGLTEKDVEDILASSRRNNGRDGLSGLLVYDGLRFLQALEGPEDAVRTTFKRIRLDSRHRAAVMLSEREVTAKQFGSWAMACQRANAAPGGISLPQVVDTLVGAVPDPNIRALFSSFVRIERVSTPSDR